MNCEAIECDRPARAGGYCQKHYMRLRRHGSLEKPVRPSTPKLPCVIDGCEKIAFTRGWCRTHYTRWYETGSTSLGVRTPVPPPIIEPRPIEERFATKVKKGATHWIWTGSKTKLGYGMIWDNEKKGHAMAHRVSWEMSNGRKIPDGLQIDHLCRVPSCVNPAHLEAVTPSVNTARGLAPRIAAVYQRSKMNCPQGHPYSPENTYIHPVRGSRSCKTCSHESTRRSRARAKAARMRQ